MDPRENGTGKRNIMHVIDSLDCGGAQRLLVNLAEWTPTELYETTICVLQPGLELRGEVESRGVPVVAFNRPRPSLFQPHRLIAYVLKNVRDLARHCRERKIHVLHCHLSDAELLGIPTGVLCRLERILTTIHYPDILPQRKPLDIRNGLRRLVSHLIYNKWADYVIAVSEDVAVQLKDLFSVRREKLRLVLNRIDVEAFRNRTADKDLKRSLGIEQGEHIITHVARLMPPKGHRTLLQAVHRLAAGAHPHFKLLLVGDGLLRDELTELCQALGISDKVVFLGSRPDIPEILAVTDIFVLPSLWEGTSLALLEAMASGRSILATDIPGNRAVIQHGYNGYLVPKADPEALARGLAFLLSNPDVASRLAINAQTTAEERFDIRKTVAELMELWG